MQRRNWKITMSGALLALRMRSSVPGLCLRLSGRLQLLQGSDSIEDDDGPSHSTVLPPRHTHCTPIFRSASTFLTITRPSHPRRCPCASRHGVRDVAANGSGQGASTESKSTCSLTPTMGATRGHASSLVQVMHCTFATTNGHSVPASDFSRCCGEVRTNMFLLCALFPPLFGSPPPSCSPSHHAFTPKGALNPRVVLGGPRC
jgi:hypothetical protein